MRSPVFREASGDLWPRVFKVTTSLDLPHATAELEILASASSTFGNWPALSRLTLLLTCYVGVMQAVYPSRLYTDAEKEAGIRNIRDMMNPILDVYQSGSHLLNVCDMLSLSAPELPAKSPVPVPKNLGPLSPHRPASLTTSLANQSPVHPTFQLPGLSAKAKGKARAVDPVEPQQEAIIPKIAARPSQKPPAVVTSTPAASGIGSKYVTPNPKLRLKPNMKVTPYIDVPYVKGVSSKRPAHSVSPLPDRRAAVKALFRDDPEHVESSDSHASDAYGSGPGSDEESTSDNEESSSDDKESSSDDKESDSDDAPVTIVSRRPAPGSTKKVKVVPPAPKVTTKTPKVTKSPSKKAKPAPRKAVTSPVKRAVQAAPKKVATSRSKKVVPAALEGKLTAAQVKAIKAVRDAANTDLSSIMGVSRLHTRCFHVH